MTFTTNGKSLRRSYRGKISRMDQLILAYTVGGSDGIAKASHAPTACLFKPATESCVLSTVLHSTANMSTLSMRAFGLWKRASPVQRRTFAQQRKRILIPTRAPDFPAVEQCPSPTCHCRPMPEGLDIDRESPLNGTMAAYAEQVLISTGMHDWKSRIEEDEDAGLVKELKALLGRGGKYSDVRSSFPYDMVVEHFQC